MNMNMSMEIRYIEPAALHDEMLRLRQEGVRMKDAVRRVAEDTGLPRNDLYNAALAEME